jgi:hypothetical protein
MEADAPKLPKAAKGLERTARRRSEAAAARPKPVKRYFF